MSWGSKIVLLGLAFYFFFRQQAQHSPGPRASHRKAQGRTTTPACNRKRKAQHTHQRQTRKTEARRNEAPPTRRGSRSLHDHAPTAADPTTTTGEAHTKWGSGPTNYTQALNKNARRPCTKTRTVRRGAQEPQKEASLAIRKPCTTTAMQTCAAHKKAGRPKRCQAAEKGRNTPKNANPEGSQLNPRYHGASPKTV